MNEISLGRYKLIYITTPNKREAKKIAKFLIEEKLAACVNVFPIESLFWWQKKIQREKEFALLVKTKTDLVEEIIKMVKRIHPYKIPCVISLPIERGHQKFLDWIEEVTKKVT